MKNVLVVLLAGRVGYDLEYGPGRFRVIKNGIAMMERRGD